MASPLERLNKKPGLRNQLQQPVAQAQPAPGAELPTPEQAKERKQLESFAAQAGQAEDPFKFDLKTALQKSIIADVQSPELTKAKKEIEDEYKTALEEYKQDKDTTKWAQVAETLGQALTQLGAGAYGLKHGVDMSGLQFSRADWKSGLEQSLQQLKLARAERAEQLAAKERKEAGVLGKLARLRELEAPAEALDPLEAAKLRKARAEAEMAERKVAEAPAAPKVKLSAAEQERDKVFAKELGKKQPGQITEAQKNLRQIDWAMEQIEKPGTVTGGMMQFLPKIAREVADKKSVAIQETVEQVVQRNLRPTLGAQFTEKEGERLIQRAYNPRLSEAENLRRLDSLKKQMTEALRNEEEAAAYFEENGTLKGFTKKLYRTSNDFDFPAAAPKKKEVSETERKRSRLEELRRKKAGK